ncbi:MAG: type II toxin-antitoxin system PemK/MazF family toxin [Nanoarchaeota archaeon]|nr:type II toxin-antitoxin system PemK/MazF family toxin [Nanoarchaeota archaeon]
MPKPGDVILTNIQFVDSFEIKKRPALVLFEEFGNIIVAGITSNKKMEGVAVTKKDGAIKESVIKLNYLFTVSEKMIEKILFHLPKEKKKQIFGLLVEKLAVLEN